MQIICIKSSKQRPQRTSRTFGALNILTLLINSEFVLKAHSNKA